MHFASWMDICHLKNSELEPKFQKYKRSSRTLRWHCERWFRIVCCIYWTRTISITDDGCTGHGYYIKTTRMRMTYSRRSIRLHPAQNGRCTDIKKKFRSRNVRILDKHKWPKSWSTVEDPVVPLERNLYGHPLAGLFYGKGNLRKSYSNTVERRFPIGNADSYTAKKGYYYLCMWMTSNWLERNTILIRCGKYSIKKLIWENQHLSWIMYIWDALNDNVK